MEDNNNSNLNKKDENPLTKKFYICTAIAYPNGVPHMGHALEWIQADALARYYRLKGENVFFQTGTDEHGKKNMQTAEKEGKTVIQFLDDNVSVFRELYQLLNISFDGFIRTSDKKIHYPACQTLWNKLQEKGDLYKQAYTGLYCVGCESFKTEKELIEGKCPDHITRDIETVEEENYFFKLSKYAEEIAKKIDSNELLIVPDTRKKEILNFLAEAKDISFSRPSKSLPWGIPVPNDPEHVMYVWCDALSNYITGIGYAQDDRSDQFNSTWPADVQVLGRDILKFHAAYWPAMLMSAGLPLPKELMVHGFLKMGGLKMGKSTGNTIDPFIQARKYGVDPFRYYILGTIPVDADGEYAINIIEERINNELVANFSNLCYRSLSVIANPKGLNGKVGECDVNDPLIPIINAKIDSIMKSYESRDFRGAVAEIMEVSSLGNKYLQDNAPWKGSENSSAVLALCVNLVKNLSIILTPIMPDLCLRLQAQLGISKPLTFKDLGWELKNYNIGKPEILVKRIELTPEDQTVDVNKNVSVEDKKKKNYKGPAKEGKEKGSTPAAELPMDVSRLNIRVGKIINVRKHESADTLYIEEIDVGESKPRQVVSGLVKFVPIEEMQNREVVLLCNLKAANLKGVKSEAMVLAASNSDHTQVELVMPPQGSKIGERVFVDGFPGECDAQLNPKHKVWETVQPDLKSNDSLVACYKGIPLKTSAGVCTVKSIANGTIK